MIKFISVRLFKRPPKQDRSGLCAHMRVNISEVQSKIIITHMGFKRRLSVPFCESPIAESLLIWGTFEKEIKKHLFIVLMLFWGEVTLATGWKGQSRHVLFPVKNWTMSSHRFLLYWETSQGMSPQLGCLRLEWHWLPEIVKGLTAFSMVLNIFWSFLGSWLGPI